MFAYETGDLVIRYESAEGRTTESRGIVLEDEGVRYGMTVAKVLWKVLPEYRSFFATKGDKEPEEFDGYTIEWVLTETLGLVCKLTTEELLLHGHPIVQAIGQQRFGNESSCR